MKLEGQKKHKSEMKKILGTNVINKFSRPTIGDNKYQISAMSEKHHQIVRLNAVGYGSAEIAKKLGITQRGVNNVLGSAICKLKLDQLRGVKDTGTLAIMEDIETMMPDALNIMKGVMAGGVLATSETDTYHDRALQAKVSKDILGMGGISPVKRTESKSTSMHLTTNDIKDLVSDAVAAGIDCGDIIDVEHTTLKSED